MWGACSSSWLHGTQRHRLCRSGSRAHIQRAPVRTLLFHGTESPDGPSRTAVLLQTSIPNAWTTGVLTPRAMPRNGIQAIVHTSRRSLHADAGASAWFLFTAALKSQGRSRAFLDVQRIKALLKSLASTARRERGSRSSNAGVNILQLQLEPAVHRNAAPNKADKRISFT